MLMVEPPPKKIPYTFFTPSFHYHFYPHGESEEADELEEAGPSSWRIHLVVFTYPHEGKVIDYFSPWRYDNEKSTLSP